MKVGFYLGNIKHFFKPKYGKVAALCLIALILQSPMLIHGAWKQASDKRVSLKITAASIPSGLTQLQDKSGYQINYDQTIFNPNSRINLDIKELTVKEALARLLTNTQVGFKFADQQTIILYKLPDPVKSGKIAGTIVDEKGEKLPGASVKVMETGQSLQTGLDGSFILNIKPGIYTLKISYISYQSQRITGLQVVEGKTTPLNIALKPDTKGLQEVVVTADYKKASTAGLLTRQKNASEISNGISAEQIARTPDKNIGESLKRISGISTVDNKFVLVRGIGERYNSAMLDGTLLPSTEAQSRNFSFDMIPAGLVDNVIVSKTVTPDMNASFGGGLIQINTKDIPNENFMNFSMGAAYNDQTTGKEFLSHKRGKNDYLGFDDGRRDFPTGLVTTTRGNVENDHLSDEAYQLKIDGQSRKFTNDNFTMYKYQAIPSQNYQFTIGRLLSVDTSGKNKLGFTGALTYRNTQTINQIQKLIRGDWYKGFDNSGASYGFNTTLGALLNAGIQMGKNRFSLRNTYTHVYDNVLTRIKGYDMYNGADDVVNNKPFNLIRESDDPTYTDLLQNKIAGQHQFGRIKLEWDIARTAIKRQEKDVGIASSGPVSLDGKVIYVYHSTVPTEPVITALSRQHYLNTEKHYSWGLSGILPFDLYGSRSILKLGYFGNRKKAAFNWEITALAQLPLVDEGLTYLPVGERLKPENMRKGGYTYSIAPFFIDDYAGNSRLHAGYAMLDNRFSEKLRLVWGLRTEYYKYNEIKNRNNTKTYLFEPKPDKHWQWMPSANLTYSPVASLNLRGAYSSSVVRPDLMDNSQFWRYSPYLDGDYGNEGLYSTRIDSWDFKAEWFPGLGEIISLGGYYKKFDKPTELTYNNKRYYLKSADWAKVYGLELELRKSLGFITDATILKNLTIYGNLTLQKSEVRSFYLAANPDPQGQPREITVSVRQKRAMYGQSPYQLNAGIQYTTSRLGFNLIYNKSGYKTYIVSETPTQIEYERARDIFDAQLSYKLFHKRLEIKLNASNIFNRPSIYYRNTETSYELNPDAVVDSDYSDTYRLKPGFTKNYEDGDEIKFVQRFGRTYSTTLTYTF